MQKDTGHLPSLIRDYSWEIDSAIILHYSIRQRLTTKRPINISPARSMSICTRNAYWPEGQKKPLDQVSD
jgi:hypothetical protein